MNEIKPGQKWTDKNNGIVFEVVRVTNLSVTVRYKMPIADGEFDWGFLKIGILSKKQMRNTMILQEENNAILK